MGRMTNTNALYAAQKSVTSSGTPVQLADQPVPEGVSIVLKAKDTNTGYLTLGSSSTNALNTGTSNFRLQANQTLMLQVGNTNILWLDATVSGETLEIIFEQNQS